jgi:uncharacterized OB-fold protein
MSLLGQIPALADVEPVRGLRVPARLDYTFTAGEATSRFLRGIKEKRILGERCPVCQKVYVPPRGACPEDGVPTAEQVEVKDTGIVTTFCVVNLDFTGRGQEIPYVSATVLLDGSDIGLFGLVSECPWEEVRMGMRVEAVWVDDADLGYSLENITHFRPTGEPDADYASYEEHI